MRTLEEIDSWFGVDLIAEAYAAADGCPLRRLAAPLRDGFREAAARLLRRLPRLSIRAKLKREQEHLRAPIRRWLAEALAEDELARVELAVDAEE